MAKQLYVLVGNNGDGSTTVYGTFNKLLLDRLERYLEVCSDRRDQFYDGDGFHYQTWNLPDECTAQSVGFYDLDSNTYLKEQIQDALGD